MEYVSLRFENKMSETRIVVGLSSDHKYFLCVCVSIFILELALGRGSLSNYTVLKNLFKCEDKNTFKCCSSQNA